MAQLTALKELHVGWLPSTEVIESFPQLTMLALLSLGPTGEHLCSTSNTLICACSLV